jgi:predicted phosphodiesterase
MKLRSLPLFIALCLAAAPATSEGISEVMDDLVSRLTAQFEPPKLNELDTPAILRFVTPEEREALATDYWTFLVRVPVTVSIMRHVDQAEVPFWIEEAGFEKTSLTVASEYYTYEVWQKDFPAGPIGLGINGFDQHRPHYVVAIGPQNPDDEVNIENLYPAEFDVRTLEKGALTYHDWTELVLEEVPAELVGHRLLTTIRGRARAAHIQGAFRETPYPTSAIPDLVALTWADDPGTTQAVQWRTNALVSASALHYRETGASGDFTQVRAQPTRIEDRMLRNDRVMHRWTAKIEGLEPATTYDYYLTVGGSEIRHAPATFTTAPAGKADFNFIYLGDTHRQPAWGEMMAKLKEEKPEAAFYLLAGDLVGTGLYRDDWDMFFGLSTAVFSGQPVMPCIGNHDDHDGLGAQMYLDHFALPENAPEGVRTEGAYHFTYANALFLILDVGSSEQTQARWMEEVLKNSDAQWKFAMFHFPPYSPDEDYPLLRELWGGILESHGVDIVMSGHVHQYLRTKPLRHGQFMESTAQGTTYVTSIAIPFQADPLEADYAAVAVFEGGPLYQTIEMKGDTLHYTAVDSTGGVIDQFTIEKQGN